MSLPQAFVCGTLSSAFGPTGGEQQGCRELQWAMNMENRLNRPKQILCDPYLQKIYR